MLAKSNITKMTVASMAVFLGFSLSGVEAGMEVKLTGYAHTATQTPTFDCEGDGLHKMAFKAGTLDGVGTMQNSSCTLSKGLFVIKRDFHLQSRTPGNEQLQNVLYKVNTITGGITGNGVLKQQALFYDLPDGKAGVMNYGVSHAAPPLYNQAYIYTGQKQNDWMGSLQGDYPAVTFGDLVLPGAHDAGMYKMTLEDTEKAVAQLCGSNPVLQALCKAGGGIGAQALENFSITQKDDSATMMSLGTRYFDFRPAYLKTDPRKIAYHVHNFITGASFNEFLSGVNDFMKENPKELALLQIKDSGIQSSNFQFLSKSEVKSYLDKNISRTVGYTLETDITSYHGRTLADLVAGGKRLIVLYGNDNVNGSYSDAAYSASLSDASQIIKQLEKTVSKTGAYQFTMLQLQDTGSGALVNHYLPDVMKNPTSWANNLLLSATGNILQATKPVFDRQTYGWLDGETAQNGIKAQSGPVVLLNDFVETALSAQAVALTRLRLQTGSGS